MSTTASQTNNANDSEIKDSSKSNKVDVNASILEIRVIIGALFTILGAAFTFIYNQSSFDLSLKEVGLDSILAIMTSSWMLTSACAAIPLSVLCDLW